MSLIDAVDEFRGPTSVTLIRRDPFPTLPVGLSAAERVRRFTSALTLLRAPQDDVDKWRADVAKSQRHSRSLTLTKFPVQKGVDVTDHSRRNPDVFEFDGVLTDSPFGKFGNPTPIFTNQALRKFQKLNEYFEQREPLFVATSIRVYESIIISRFESYRDEETGGAILISLGFEELRIEAESLGDALVDEEAAMLGGVPTFNGGNQALF
jgi:hypothetical protein